MLDLEHHPAVPPMTRAKCFGQFGIDIHTQKNDSNWDARGAREHIVFDRRKSNERSAECCSAIRSAIGEWVWKVDARRDAKMRWFSFLAVSRGLYRYGYIGTTEKASARAQAHKLTHLLMNDQLRVQMTTFMDTAFCARSVG